MMRFRKEDIGLYVTFSLIGAGIGLLSGAFISKKKLERTRIADLTPEEAEQQVEEMIEDSYRFPSPRIRERVIKMVSEEDTYSEELEEFINDEDYNPTAMQIEMIHRGLVSIEEVKQSVVVNTIEPQPYDEPYRMVEEESNKPDLMEVLPQPEDIEPIDDIYQLSSTFPRGRDRSRITAIYYDHDDDTFTRLEGEETRPLHSLDGIVNAKAWEIILTFLMSGTQTVFVKNLGTSRMHSFDLVPPDKELENVGDEAS